MVTSDETGEMVVPEKVVRKEVIVEKNNEDLDAVEDNLRQENDRVKEQLEAQRRRVGIG